MIEILVNLGQFVGGILLTMGYVPQIIKTFKTRSVEDFSLPYYILVATGITLMEIYAAYNVFVHGNGHMFLVTNTLALMCSGSMALMTIMYKKK